MVRKTRKHTKKHTTRKVHSIPELRRSFEHMEEYADKKITSKETKDKMVKDLRKEWLRVFGKELHKPAAEAFIHDRMMHHSGKRRRTIRHRGGSLTSNPIAGAPLDYSVRAGVYLAPESIPTSNGHLPLANGAPSSFGSFTKYVDSGFWNPEPAQSYDPVAGQTKFPVVPVGTGSNEFNARGGSRKRKVRRGGSLTGSLVSQAFSRPIPSYSPSGPMQDMQDMWHGKTVGPSPDQVQRHVNFGYNTIYPKTISF